MEFMEQLSQGIELVKLDYPVNSKDNALQLYGVIESKGIDIIIYQWGLPYKTTMICNAAIKSTKCNLISVRHGSPYTSKVIIKA